jgi:hypothetical protein
VSVVFLEVPAGLEGSAMSIVRHQVEISVARRADMQLVGNGLSGQPDDSELVTDGLLFSQATVPGWASAGAPWIDIEHHLVVWGLRGSLMAVYCSNKAIINRLQVWLDGPPIPSLRRVDPEYMYAAFAAGQAKILWLSGVHPSEAVKPDGKTIRGVSLQNALDRLEDQTFFDSAVRATLQEGQSVILNKAITSDAQESRASYGPSTNWSEFVLVVDALLAVLEDARLGAGLAAPFPYLARIATDLTDVRDAYEVIPVNAEAIALKPDVTEDEFDAAILLDALHFEILSTNSASVTVNVVDDGNAVGQLVLFPRMRGKKAVIEAGIPVTAQPGIRETVESARDAIKLVPPAIHYLSGHTISDHRVVIREWRDHPFDYWQPEVFGCDIGREKPGNGSLVDIQRLTGEPGDDSLFGWVVAKWAAGWLVCDDGTDEVADFVHLAHDGNLTLIHVKASPTRSPARRVSSEAFEQLAAQATKNIRSLEKGNLVADLQAGPRSSSTAVWLDGARGHTRIQFANVLVGRPSRGRVSIALVQPHLQNAVLAATRADQAEGRLTVDVARLRRIDDLLHGTSRVAAAVAGTVTVYIAV